MEDLCVKSHKGGKNASNQTEGNQWPLGFGHLLLIKKKKKGTGVKKAAQRGLWQFTLQGPKVRRKPPWTGPAQASLNPGKREVKAKKELDHIVT